MSFPVAVAVLILLLACPVHAEDHRAKVLGITDGDTITLLLPQGPVTVHLSGVDCPEKGQPFARQARQFTARLLRDQTVVIREGGYDSRGLMTVEVILADGRSLNEELLGAGLAWWYDQQSDNTTWGFLEDEARLSGRGLWAQGLPVPPWEWREHEPHELPARKR